jgi:hypothetical protein
VAEFLSDAWIAQLDRAARAAPGIRDLAADRPLVIEQHVRRGDDEIVYSLHLAAEGARVEKGAASQPDVILRTDAGTALAMQRGTMTAQDAAAAGRLKVRGTMERLRAVGEALRTLDDVFGEVRAATTDPAPTDRADEHRH